MAKIIFLSDIYSENHEEAVPKINDEKYVEEIKRLQNIAEEHVDSSWINLTSTHFGQDMLHHHVVASSIEKYSWI